MVQEDIKNNPYSDIIDLPHHQSTNHRHMPIIDRAAQFSPFAALTGYDSAIRESSRLTDQRRELDETQKTTLDGRLRIIQEQLGQSRDIEVTFFQPDNLKAGGTYITIIGQVIKVDKYQGILIMDKGTRIPIWEIYYIDLLGEYETE